MSIDVLKRELAGLAPGDRRQIMAYLVSLQHQAEADYRANMARKIDDQDPTHWVDLDVLDRRLANNTD